MTPPEEGTSPHLGNCRVCGGAPVLATRQHRTHTAVFEAPEAPIVTWGGASMALRPMADLKPGGAVLIMWCGDWSTGHMDRDSWVCVDGADDIYRSDDRVLGGWVPLPEVGRGEE